MKINYVMNLTYIKLTANRFTVIVTACLYQNDLYHKNSTPIEKPWNAFSVYIYRFISAIRS